MNNLNEEYKQWLATIGFADSSVNSFPMYVNELLIFTGNTSITAQLIQTYFEQFKQRNNKTRGGGLSANHINKCVVAINNFIKFLNVTNKASINLKLQKVKTNNKSPEVYTKQEIQQLYKATFNINSNKRLNKKAYQQRDRAMLAVYYGCGLRKNEGNNLIVDAIDFSAKMVYVSKGKGSKERYVPIAEQGLQDIEAYINYGRLYFLKTVDSKETSLFINAAGKPMQNFSNRLQLLREEINILKPLSLHTLRHSIATHLLQNGMSLEHIKTFLGHSSLESTQIYTHIINESI
jgi:integrase/recombinase XerD